MKDLFEMEVAWKQLLTVRWKMFYRFDKGCLIFNIDKND